MNNDFEITIIGAGCVGLAIAEKLSRYSNSIVLIEKNENFGQGSSSRNSEVIHSGIYYDRNSLKSELCVEGRKALYELGGQEKIQLRKTGKLIVATEDNSLTTLENLYENGKSNGTDGLKLLTAKEVSKIDPQVHCKGAILSEETGILSSHSLMTWLYRSMSDNGVTTAFNTKFLRGEKTVCGYRLHVEEADGGVFYLTSKIVINAAGLYSDRVAESFGINIEDAGYELNYAKGCYVSYSGKSLRTKHLIYPVPSPEFLGIHSIIDTGGRYRFGPDIQFMSSNKEDYSMREGIIPVFYEEIRKYFPHIDPEDLHEDFCGIRPKLSSSGEKSKDFIINDEVSKNLPGLINLIGIESPGLTSCLAIGSYVRGLINL